MKNKIKIKEEDEIQKMRITMELLENIYMKKFKKINRQNEIKQEKLD